MGPHVGPDKLVISVYNSEHDDGKESFKVVVQRASLARLRDGDVLAVDGSACVREVPLVSKLFSYWSPLVWGLGSVPHLGLVLFKDRLTHLRDEERYGVVGDAEGEHQVSVAGSRGKVSQGDGELEARLQRGSAPATQEGGKI